MKRNSLRTIFGSVALLSVFAGSAPIIGPAPVHAVCSTAPIAVDDFLSIDGEPTLLDVLANDSDLEGQALTLTVLSTDCPGDIEVDQGLIVYDPGGLLVTECTISYEARDETGNPAIATAVVKPYANLFADDFESGNFIAWSSCDPSC